MLSTCVNFYLVLIATTCTQSFLEDFTPEFELLCPLFSSIKLAWLFCLSWSSIMAARSRKFLLFFLCFETCTCPPGFSAEREICWSCLTTGLATQMRVPTYWSIGHCSCLQIRLVLTFSLASCLYIEICVFGDLHCGTTSLFFISQDSWNTKSSWPSTFIWDAII